MSGGQRPGLPTDEAERRRDADRDQMSDDAMANETMTIGRAVRPPLLPAES